MLELRFLKKTSRTVVNLISFFEEEEGLEELSHRELLTLEPLVDLFFTPLDNTILFEQQVANVLIQDIFGVISA